MENVRLHDLSGRGPRLRHVEARSNQRPASKSPPRLMPQRPSIDMPLGLPDRPTASTLTSPPIAISQSDPVRVPGTEAAASARHEKENCANFLADA